MQGEWFQSLVGELRSHKLCAVAKGKNKKLQKENLKIQEILSPKITK